MPGLYDSSMSSADFETFTPSPGKNMEFNSSHHAELYYSLSSSAHPHHHHPAESPRYFIHSSTRSKSPRNRRDMEEEYDYPIGVEDLEFEDDDAYSADDLSEDEMLFDDPEIWMESLEMEDADEESAVDARYFDASDLYEKPGEGLQDEEGGEEESSAEDVSITALISSSEKVETPSPRLRDTFGESISGHRQTEPEGSPVGGNLDVPKGKNHTRTSSFANLFFGPRIRSRSN
ncbi:hypothetical protein D9613_007945 [Agrocybe pediades]|uniref:Uncharacterized protein n=1 Tax=Agrocybe pediades TaxID=84607 RepID=A0A8H4QNS2_9AGAR|nr:hypothetical protein D9613_007945 [Agrocybe pediades]